MLTEDELDAGARTFAVHVFLGGHRRVVSSALPPGAASRTRACLCEPGDNSALSRARDRTALVLPDGRVIMQPAAAATLRASLA